MKINYTKCVKCNKEIREGAPIIFHKNYQGGFCSWKCAAEYALNGYKESILTEQTIHESQTEFLKKDIDVSI